MSNRLESSKPTKTWEDLQENSVILDKQLKNCIRDNPSAQGERLCLDNAIGAWDKQLNDLYKHLMNGKDSLPPWQRGLLKDSERAWVSFKESEETVIGKLTDTENNFDNDYFRASLRLTRDRALEIQTTASDNDVPSLGKRADICLAGARDVNEHNTCLQNELDRAEKALNNSYRKLREQLNGEQKGALRESELNWIAFRNKENKYIDSMFEPSSANGAMSLRNAYSKLMVTKHRTNQLMNLTSD